MGSIPGGFHLFVLCLFKRVSSFVSLPVRRKAGRKSSVLDRVNLLLSVAIAGLLLSGCSALLPSSHEVTKSPWHNYSSVKAAYDQVVTGKTTLKQLNAIGFNLYSTPNVKQLNYLDVAATTQSIRWDYLDIDLQRCLVAKDKCQGYEIEPRDVRNNNYGNFMLDILNFRKQISQSGWYFKALFLVVDDTVIYKLWSGIPNIQKSRDIINPLGPLQDAGSLVYKTIP